MADLNSFWMVLADNSDYTRHRHGTFDGAKKEAERLALQNPGTRFFVLQCVGAAMTQRPVEWLDADEIPF